MRGAELPTLPTLGGEEVTKGDSRLEEGAEGTVGALFAFHPFESHLPYLLVALYFFSPTQFDYKDGVVFITNQGGVTGGRLAPWKGFFFASRLVLETFTTWAPELFVIGIRVRALTAKVFHQVWLVEGSGRFPNGLHPD